MAVLCVFSAMSILPAFAQEPAESGEVFDLGDVLIMEKGDEVNTITSIDTLSSYDIEMQGSQTVSEALELIPGIDVQTGGKGQSYVTLRGLTSGISRSSSTGAGHRPMTDPWTCPRFPWMPLPESR